MSEIKKYKKVCHNDLIDIYDDIKTIMIPAQATEIKPSNWSFGTLSSSMDNLERIVVEEGNTQFTAVDGVLYNRDMTELLFYPKKRAGEVFIIPESVTVIGKHSFDLNWLYDDRPELGEVIFSAGLKRIEAYAFFKCNCLTRFHIPAGVGYIGHLAFFGCGTHLKEIIVDENNTHYCSENGTLYNKAKTAILKVPPGAGHKNFTIPPTVRAIAACAFRSCVELEELTIPKGVTVIGRGAFEECGMKRLVLPEGLKIIDALAFSRCGYLEEINIPEGVTTLGGEAFCYCESLREVHLPDSITRMGVNFGEWPSAVFSYCHEMHSFTFPAYITEISPMELSSSKISGHIKLPDGVTKIGCMAFKRCKELEGVTIPAGVAEIGEEAFYDCPKLTIHCVEDSVAHKYAMENNIPFQLV
ncbi:MAG: leucine-rich repeat domain-containing protein [Defluviitaleaceae bacterium]|nr:leucine-rich repeat domain-containing protein [Defluviitaleaceae bacterium]